MRASVLKLVAVAVFAGCSPGKAPSIRELSGQVFLATKGGESIELGARDIYVIQETQLRSAKSNIERLLVGFRANAVPSEAKRRYRNYIDDAVGEAQEWVNSIKVGIDEDELFSRTQDLHESIFRIENDAKSVLESHHPSRDERLWLIYQELERIALSEAAVTDSSGHFHLEYDGETIVFASASRSLIDGSNENFFWFERPSDSLLLTNRNSVYEYQVISELVGLLGINRRELDSVVFDSSAIDEAIGQMDGRLRKLMESGEQLVELAEESRELEQARITAMREAEREEERRLRAIRYKQQAIDKVRSRAIGSYFVSVGLGRSFRIDKVTIKGFSEKGVIVRHAGGSGTIRWEDIPREWNKFRYPNQ